MNGLNAPYSNKIKEIEDRLIKIFRVNNWQGITLTMNKDGRKLYIQPLSNKTIKSLSDVQAFSVDCNDECVPGRTYGSLMYSRTIRELAIKINKYPNLISKDSMMHLDIEQELLQLYLENPIIQAWQDQMQKFYDEYGYYPNPYKLACAQHNKACVEDSTQNNSKGE